MLALMRRTRLQPVFGEVLSSTLASKVASTDPLQEHALKETCFVVDQNDNIIKGLSKRECHQVGADGSIPLHRAFSVFLFNKKGQLLLQKRSNEKITYPGHYTNSCCSHPIGDVPGEADGVSGIKKAAVRRLNYELGIPTSQVPLDKLEYITRIVYEDKGNGIWGEHEIDYILFLQANVDLNPNPNEISGVSFVPRNQLDDFLPTLDGPLTPWFKLILQHRLRLWWDNLGNLNQFHDHTNILHLKE